ncbi:hypothetical protein [Syntrophomonas wolfei]|jgi:hypothetical protein|uniref:hypothetical protein n=1 Tax=Syntrophomonas wolfei TaxID=863 RepID=UPI0023F01156|nr:hypothetical protein [Syntrophomonas wolfei]
MKLIIKQYLSSLREREELDVILPDLLSQMGFNVISHPRRGTKQYGVDVAAVGKDDSGLGKVYLFSVKSGDLTQSSWDGNSNQALRPSLNEIIDAYIPTRIPPEHKDKEIVICLCIGGEIQEQIRTEVTNYEVRNTRQGLSFIEWNGDKLSDLILSTFLKEKLLPTESRPLLRKSLALIDEPDASFTYYLDLIKKLAHNTMNNQLRIRTLRQMNICLWILFSWCRDANNLESAYLAAEASLLYAWDISKGQYGKKNKNAVEVQYTFISILRLYHSVSFTFLGLKIMPYCGINHGLSATVRSSNKLDVNLKLFDILGRLALAGIWSYWISITSRSDEALRLRYLKEQEIVIRKMKQLINNNPTLSSPVKDDQAIDVFIAALLLYISENEKDNQFLAEWLSEILQRAILAFQCHEFYPCILRSYHELLEHPKRGDEEYQQEVTAGSILYPIIALWAAMLEDENLYSAISEAKKKEMEHCNFQLWYPDEETEENLYTNQEPHGAILSNLNMQYTPDEYIQLVWDECRHLDYFDRLSAVKLGIWPLIIVACRHYRLPVPVHFTMSEKRGGEGFVEQS